MCDAKQEKEEDDDEIEQSEKEREKEISFTFSFSLLDSFCLVSFLVFIFHFRHANEGISGCRLFVLFLLLRSDVHRNK